MPAYKEDLNFYLIFYCWVDVGDEQAFIATNLYIYQNLFAFVFELGGLHTWPVDLRGEGTQQCDWWRAERSTFGPSH